MDITAVVVALIPAVASIITVVINSKRTNVKVENLHTMSEQSQVRSEILQLIMEDKISVMEGKLPSNYKDVINLYDYYDSKHWNTWVHRKVDEYEKWYLDLTKNKQKRNK